MPTQPKDDDSSTTTAELLSGRNGVRPRESIWELESGRVEHELID